MFFQPLYIDGEILYSNRILLDRYDEKPPETWDELIRIASKIKENESEKGNDDLIIFAPNFAGTFFFFFLLLKNSLKLIKYKIDEINKR